MLIALLFWMTCLMFGIVVSIILCINIEKTKVKRWGATGSFWRYKTGDKS